MTLKRKRSVDQSPVSVSSFAASTPDAQSPTPMPNSNYGDSVMDIDPERFVNTYRALASSFYGGSGLGSRTRKRHRNDRPEEGIVHETTIEKLFAAQRKHPRAEPIYYELSHTKPAQKSTLHNFWKIDKAPPVQRPSLIVKERQSQPHCQDCEGCIRDEMDSMDIDMDIGELVPGNQFACHDCGKNVCAACAVMGNVRHCLKCATDGSRSGRWW